MKEKIFTLGKLLVGIIAFNMIVLPAISQKVLYISKRDGSYQWVLDTTPEPDVWVNGDSLYWAKIEEAGIDLTVDYDSFKTCETWDIDSLYTYDVVIIGRGISSGDFDNVPQDEDSIWNTLTIPVIEDGMYGTRNSRLKWFNTGAQYQYNAVDTFFAKVPDPSDPIFTGIDIPADSVLPVLQEHAILYPTSVIGRGDTVCTGKYLLTLDHGTTDTAKTYAADSSVGENHALADAVGMPLMIRWSPGDSTYIDNGTGDKVLGYRTYIASGEDHFHDFSTGVTNKNFYNKTDIGMQLMINEIKMYLEMANADLSDISVGGSTVAGFDGSVVSYTYTLSSCDTSDLEVIAATAVGLGSTIVIDTAAAVSDTTEITVTAFDGVTTKVYKVAYAQASDTVATLSDLAVDGTTVTGFDPDVLSYTHTITLGADTAAILDSLTAVATDDGCATVTITKVTDVADTAEVKVVAANGTDSLIYKVAYHVEASDDADLADLLVEGTSIPGFDAATLQYDWEVANGIDTVPDVTYVLSDTNATAVQTDAASPDGDSTVVAVTAQDGATTQDYVIRWSVAPADSNVNLATLIVSEGALDPAFAAGTLAYIDSMDFGTASVQVTATAVSATSTVAPADSTYTLAAGPSTQTASVVVTSQAGTSQTYTIELVVKAEEIGISNQFSDQINIRPNPTTGRIVVELPVNNANITITDMAGRLIQTMDVSNSVTELDLSDQSTGNYIMTITSGQNVATRTIILK